MGDHADDAEEQAWLHEFSMEEEEERALAGIWTTSTGEEIKIEDMDDRHLLNCINYLDRRDSQEKDYIRSLYKANMLEEAISRSLHK